jgi:TIR domain
MPKSTRDIFVCHAGEDKDDVVRPLVEALSEAGVSCWYDEAEIQWGDSITQKVNEGLASSKFVVVVFSPAFVQKNWPQRELNSVLNQEASSGEVKVLPLLVGTEKKKKEILSKYALLNDKQYLPWGGDVGAIVDAILSRLGRGGTSAKNKRASSQDGIGVRIPLPKLKKKFTQRDRDLFLRNAFTVVKQFFKEGLEELERQNEELDTDLAEVTNFKFLSTIYLKGEVAARCKIWVGGPSSSDAIAYYEGRSYTDSDSSYHDMLSVADDEQALGFKPSGMWFRAPEYQRDQLLTAEQAAEYLWQRFTERLE